MIIAAYGPPQKVLARLRELGRLISAARRARRLTQTELAERAGTSRPTINRRGITARNRQLSIMNRDVLVIERFDSACTPAGESRRHFSSALTALDLDEMETRYASYPGLAEITCANAPRNPSHSAASCTGAWCSTS